MVMVFCVVNIMGDFGVEVIKVELLQGDLNCCGYYIFGMLDLEFEYCYY